MRLQEGDIVKLKTGGPYMVVDRLVGDPPRYKCVFYSEGFHTETLGEKSLRLCTPEELEESPPGKKWKPGIVTPPQSRYAPQPYQPVDSQDWEKG